MKRKRIRFGNYGLALGLIATLTLFVASCSSTSTKIPIHTLPPTPTPTLTSIALAPAPPANLVPGSTTQLFAIGKYSDGSVADLTFLAIWASSNTDIATISMGGLATCKAVGNTDITAAMWGVTSAPVRLTVVTPTATTTSP